MFTGVREPWTLIRVNAALHAMATLLLLRLITYFVPDSRRAIWAVLPFLLYPSAMAWYAQIHKDGYFATGTYLVLYGWVLLARSRVVQEGVVMSLRPVLWITLGGAFIWLIRPHAVQVLQLACLPLAIVLPVACVVRAARSGGSWRQAASVVVAAALGIVVLIPYTLDEASDRWLADGPRPPAASHLAARGDSPGLSADAGRPRGLDVPIVWRAAESRPVFVAQHSGTRRLPKNASPAQDDYDYLDRVIGGWRLVAVDLNAPRLVADEAVNVKLYWRPAAETNPADPDALAGGELYPDEGGRWVQFLRPVKNKIRDGGFQQPELSKRYPAEVGFPVDFYGEGARPRQLAPDVRNGRPTTVMALHNSATQRRSSLVSESFAVEPGRLYLQAG